MDTSINYLLRDCSALKRIIDANRSGMEEAGFTEESYLGFTGAMADLALKETAQEKAVKEVAEKTSEQNDAVAEIVKLISDVRASAKSAYGKNPRELKLFNVGSVIPKSINNLIPVCNYTVELVESRKAILLKNGLKQSKIEKLAAAPAELKLLEDVQENAKKIQKSRTLERDASAKVLKDYAFKIRNFAKACFSDKPEILVQFDPIPKGRGLSNPAEETQQQIPASPAV